ncbi:MAG TPA: glycosyltransferase family 4 protein [Jatrophihabitans sp.]|jgi:hypothetical protein
MSKADLSTTGGADRIHVLVAHPGAELYGSDQQVVRSVEAFCAVGWRVTVALPERGALCTELGDVTVTAIASPVLRRAWLRPLGLVRLVAQTPLAILRQVRMIRALRPDVVFVNTVTLPHWVLAARLARCRVVVHAHEAEEGVSRGLRAALYLPLLLAHRVIANSDTTRRVIAAAAARLRSRIRVVFNGVADPGAQPTTASVPGRLTVVSRLSPRKGVHDAIETLRLLVAAGRDLTLEVCGTVFAGYEWYEAELRETVRAAGLDDRVIFAGFVSPIEHALARAEIVLAPSYGESFGNSVVEAMLAERPVVASAVQGLAEVVDHRRTGMLTPAGDAAAVAEVVAQLLDDPEQARRIAFRARQEARSRFATERYGRALTDAVLEVLEGTNRGKPQGFLKSEQIVAQDISSDAKFAMLNSYRRPGARPALRVVGR